MEQPAVLVLAGVLAALVFALLLLVVRARCRPIVRDLAPAAGPTPLSTGERLRRGLAATRRRLGEQLDTALGRGNGGREEAFAALEEALVGADVGVQTAAHIVGRVRQRAGTTVTPEELRPLVREELQSLLEAPPPPVPNERPWVVLVTGVNGVGKTTTIGKLAASHVAAGRRVLLVAADTFRAGAIDQLAIWAERTGAGLVRQGPGASPAAVVFDGMKAALGRDVDVVLIDTAGRLHTRSNLMDELRKVRRVIERELPGAPHETLLVLDATTGQNALTQARTFLDSVGVTGIALTKLDGTARGGVVFAVRHELGVPVRYVGLGEGVADLRPFDAGQFVAALLDGDASGMLTATSSA